jgi:hypothetical protein
VVSCEQVGKTEKAEYAFKGLLAIAETQTTKGQKMKLKSNLGYKLLLIGCLLVFAPFALAELLGIDLYPVQTLINLSYTFGLASIAIAAYTIYYRGKRKH